jgi:hypothetical protein
MLSAKLYLMLGLAFGLKITSTTVAAPGDTVGNDWISAPQGSVVRLDELWSQQRELPSVPLQISSAHGPQLLLSDKPEYFYTGDGIALQEEVKPGVVRLYVYHVPDPTHGPETISAVIENLGAKPMKLRFLHYASPAPGRDYHRIGKEGLMEFFNSKEEKTARKIPVRGRAVIDPKLDKITVSGDELAHGFYEFEIDQPARVSTFEREPGMSSVDAIDKLPKLPLNLPGRRGNGAGRGLFPGSDYDVSGQGDFVVDTAKGPMLLVVADGRHDPVLTGRDDISGTESVRDNGNYGAMYRIRLKRRSSDGRGLALLMTNRGYGEWCGGQAGAVKVSRGCWPAGTVAVPTDRVEYGKPGEMVIIQKFPPLPKGRTETIEITYSPPGASCIPTPMLLVPY